MCVNLIPLQGCVCICGSFALISVCVCVWIWCLYKCICMWNLCLHKFVCESFTSVCVHTRMREILSLPVYVCVCALPWQECVWAWVKVCVCVIFCLNKCVDVHACVNPLPLQPLHPWYTRTELARTIQKFQVTAKSEELNLNCRF